MMKIKTIMYSTIFSLVSSVAIAGNIIDIPVQIDTVVMSAAGSMKTARYSENENAQLGCGTRTVANTVDNSFYKWGFCQATNDDIADNRAFCFTENAGLLSEIDSMDNNDFVTFRWDEAGNCTFIGNSTQSQYIAENKDESKKVKKDNKE